MDNLSAFRKFTLGGGTTIESNVDGFDPTDKLAQIDGLLSLGFITEEQAEMARADHAAMLAARTGDA